MEFIFFVGGVLIGIFLIVLASRKEPIGTLKVVNTDLSSSPYLFLEIDKGKSYRLQKDRYVTFRVDISHN